MKIVDLDHVVLRVTDMERSVRWYTEVLGLHAVRLEEWRRGEAPFVSIRVTPSTIIDLQLGEISGTNVDHLALVVDDVDLAALAASGALGDVRPPRDLFGARGVGQGIYVRDPDGHGIELRTYADIFAAAATDDAPTSAVAISRPASGTVVTAATEMEWQPTDSPGFWSKPLFADSATRGTTSLMRVDAGAFAPPHSHDQVEEILIIDGEFSDEHNTYRAGDYCVRAIGEMHTSASVDGCTVLLVYRD